MLKLSHAWPIALGLLLPLAGCHNTVNTLEIPAGGDTHEIQTDANLANIARVTAVRKTRVGDLLRVQVDITNTTNSEETIMYRFDWIDNDGMQYSGTLNSWQRIVLEGGQRDTLNGVAPTSNIRDVRVLLQQQ